MSWKRKLLLDAVVAAVVWTIGLVLFVATGETDDLFALLLVPLAPAEVFWLNCKDWMWTGRCNVYEWLWLVGVPLSAATFFAQFLGRRAWTAVPGAVAVALWWGAGVFLAWVWASLHPW